ncbi:MAG: DUF4148 domain-containing protein [Chitinophagaceae bacterium]|nr:DUF4148 domain-containing protein [Rubrivivax sp.]
MNKLQLFVYPAVAVLSLAAAVSAHAESPSIDNSATQVWTQAKTRAQVQAEMLQARADGSLKVWSSAYNPFQAVKSVRSRDEVRTEAIAARSTRIDALYGEDSGSFALGQVTPARTAAPVYAYQPRIAK